MLMMTADEGFSGGVDGRRGDVEVLVFRNESVFYALYSQGPNACYSQKTNEIAFARVC